MDGPITPGRDYWIGRKVDLPGGRVQAHLYTHGGRKLTVTFESQAAYTADLHAAAVAWLTGARKPITGGSK